MATTYEIEQLLVREAGRIGPEIYRRTVDTSIWNKVASQSTETFPEEMGDTVSVLTFERSLPHFVDSSTGEALAHNWSDTLRSNPTNSSVTVGADGIPVQNPNNQSAEAAGNNPSFGQNPEELSPARSNINPPLIGNIRFGQTLRKYALAHAAIESPDLSLQDLIFPVRRREQLSNMMSVLSEATNYIWQERYRDEFIRVSGNKLIAKTTGAGTSADPFVRSLVPLGGTSVTKAEGLLVQGVGSSTAEILTSSIWAAQAGATAEARATASGLGGIANVGNLDYASLKKLYLSMIRDGASTNAMGRENGAPLFLLITSAETSENLIWQYTRNGEKLSADLRYAKPNELLAPLGIERSYFGFYHAVDMHLPRYTWNATTGFSRVYPYKRTNAGAKGFRWEVNTSYENATYEASILYHRDVCSYLVPKAPSVNIAGADFDAPSYRGDFRWVNIKDRITNPDGQVGYFRATFGTGTKPVQPYFGYVIIHKRADVL